MNENNEAIRKPINREVRVKLLEIMREGFISQDDLNYLSDKIGIELQKITVEIIDKREQIEDFD